MRLASCSMQDSTLAGTLANVCNTIQYGTSTVCQGFVYDNKQKVAFFKGGGNGQPVNTSSVLCSSPTGTAWLRDTGRPAPHHSLLKSALLLCCPRIQSHNPCLIAQVAQQVRSQICALAEYKNAKLKLCWVAATTDGIVESRSGSSSATAPAPPPPPPQSGSGISEFHVQKPS